jgi:DNA-binding protein H-NS
MAKANGTLTDKQVSDWFNGLGFDHQAAVLSTLATSHSKLRNARISELRRELAALNGNGAPINGKRKYIRRKAAAAIQAKYRDPKSGETWSGRGRMASWLAAKLKAGEKASRYLIKRNSQ